MRRISVFLAGVFVPLLFCFSCGSASSAVQSSFVPEGEEVAFARPESISAGDLPDGFASVDMSLKVSADSAKVVSTKSELLSALRRGSVVYVNGMIDLSEGMLPDEAGGSNPALDSFVKSRSRFSTYAEYKEAYAAACSFSTDDTSNGRKSSLYDTMHSMNIDYRDKIRLSVPSNTVIIGLTAESGFFGGAVFIDGVSNVVLRNLVIRDAYDPFPHHEDNDGYNAQHDAVSVSGSKNVWIDHCTLYDTRTISYVLTGGKSKEKWQTYDGLLDITGSCDKVTVSYCKFMRHDKVMLIGSSDSESISPDSRKVTLHHNYFYNCGQRLPMVRLTKVHTYNNLFEVDKTAPYDSQYALGVRYNALIQSEKNYYGSGIKYSFSGHQSKQGTVYSVGDVDRSSNGKKSGQFKTSKSALFSIPYPYAALPVDEVPEYVRANAGAGTIPIVR